MLDAVCMGELILDMFPGETGRKLAEVGHQGPVKGMGVLASSYDLNYFDNVVVE